MTQIYELDQNASLQRHHSVIGFALECKISFMSRDSGLANFLDANVCRICVKCT